MTDTHVRLKYYLYRAVGNPGFILPVYTLYVLSYGVTYTQLGVIGTVQAAITLTGEIPTGYVGDRIGRRNSLLVANVLFAGSTIGMLTATDFVGFLVSFSLLSVANTFVSGSGDAWLYDALAEQLDEDSYTFVRGRGAAVGQWAMTLMMLASGFLYVVDPRYPFWAALGTNVAAVLAVAAMPKNAQYTDSDADSDADGDADADADADADDDPFTIVDALPVIRRKLTEPPLRSFVAYMALVTGVTMMADAYIQPITVNVLDSSFEGLLRSYGVPEAASLGVLYAGFTFASAIASDFASDIEDALGVGGALLVVPVAVAALFVLAVPFPLVVFPMFFAMKASGSVTRTIASGYVNDHTDSVGRATVLSAISMVYALARIPFALSSGVIADATAPRVAIAVFGGVLIVGAAVAYLWFPPVASTDAETTAAGASEA